MSRKKQIIQSLKPDFPDHIVSKNLELFHLKKIRQGKKIKVKDTEAVLFLKPTPTLGNYAAVSDLGAINIFDVLTGSKIKEHKSGDKSVADILFLESEDNFLTTDLGK